MMKRPIQLLILFLAGILIFCSNELEANKLKPSVSQGVKFEKISLADSLKRAEKENKLVLMDFYSPT
jgi:hypothetical protein